MHHCALQKKAAALYTQAGDYQKTARFYYKKAEDTYYQANNWASYDDWRRARDQWDYFYSREFLCCRLFGSTGVGCCRTVQFETRHIFQYPWFSWH